MAADRKLVVEIIGDSRSVERSFARVNKAAGNFGSRMKSLAKITAIGIGVAFVGLGAILRKGFREFMEGQKVMAQTRAVLSSTGGVANVTAKRVDALASSLSRMSGIDDEAIASGENMLLTFTNIRNGLGRNNKIFDEATKTVLDMSVALGRDIPTVAIMVGKALNDLELNAKGTITGWSALRRVGVKITADMMKQAAAFIRAGKPMKAQQLLLRELNMEFGGSAKAFGSTLPGAFAKLRNALDEVTGAFAEGLAPVVQRVANMLANKMANPEFVARVRALGKVVGEKLLAAFRGISTWFQTHWESIRGALQRMARLATLIANNWRAFAIVLGTVVVAKMALLNKQLLIMSLRIAPLVAGLLALQQYKEEGFWGKGGSWKDIFSKKSIPGYGWIWGGDSNEPPKPASKRNIKKAVPIGGHRARGGPVMPGVAYTVGERGRETFVPNTRGSIIPNGGGGITITGPVYVTAPNPRAFLDELQRVAKSRAGQTRGRFGGQKLALG